MIKSFIYFIGQGVDGEELLKNNTVPNSFAISTSRSSVKPETNKRAKRESIKSRFR